MAKLLVTVTTCAGTVMSHEYSDVSIRDLQHANKKLSEGKYGWTCRIYWRWVYDEINNPDSLTK